MNFKNYFNFILKNIAHNNILLVTLPNLVFVFLQPQLPTRFVMRLFLYACGFLRYRCQKDFLLINNCLICRKIFQHGNLLILNLTLTL